MAYLAKLTDIMARKHVRVIDNGTVFTKRVLLLFFLWCVPYRGDFFTVFSSVGRGNLKN